MALDPVTNFAKVRVSGTYTAGETTIELAVTQSSLLPNTGSFNLVWWNTTDYADPSDDPDKEIVRVNCVNTTDDVLTVVRGQESTLASAKDITGSIYNMILAPTQKTIDDIGTVIFDPSTGHNHDGTGTNGSLVRTDAPLSDTDESTDIFLKYYGFRLSTAVWQIAKVDLRDSSVIYSLSESNTVTYENAWITRTALTYAAWTLI